MKWRGFLLKAMGFLSLSWSFWGLGIAWAEYRAYELEVFDIQQQKSEILITSFSPIDYVLTHGGPQRITTIVRAAWTCYGDTSGYTPPCAKPEPVNPQFKVGDKVQVRLKKHITDQWQGIIENIIYLPEAKVNVYGVRFEERKKLYNRYYEFNLQKAP